MAKPNLKEAMGNEFKAVAGKGSNALFGDEPKIEAPTAEVRKMERKYKKPTLEEMGEERYTFIVNIELLNQVRKLAYWKQIKIKDVFEDALRAEIKKYETKVEKLKEIPVREKNV